LSDCVPGGHSRWGTIRDTERYGSGVSSVPGIILFWRKAALVVSALLVLATCSAAQKVVAPINTSTDPPPAKSAPTKEHKHAATKPSAPEVAAALPAPPPKTPEQMPANPPQVTYNDGLLSIVANNSTLSDILREVGVSTGATVDAPPGLARERVVVRIGPGAPRNVLSELLTGSRFDYILVGANGDPNSVTSIMLSASQGSASGAASPPPMVRAGTPPPPEPEEEADEEPPVPEPPAPAQPPQQPPTQAQRSLTPQQPPDQVSGQPAGSGEGGQQIRTPEQMLEQLRRMQPTNTQPNAPPNPPQ